MTQGPTVLVTVTLPAGATLTDALRRYGLTSDEVDEAYGLVPVDPAQGLYALLVSEEAAARITGGPGVSGPYANPPIEPYGPPRSGPGSDDGGR
ncbi:hypothetical protein ACIHEJ_04345 [Streptomyces sp. NPDC052301]|uniref:hypothetical protein n=1 Tax=Streptomyces sp. NPDC052301 TaxID=3365687 RepID=UPI0037D9686E